MRTITAREIKRRGISVVDQALMEGPVHINKNDVPRYVIMHEAYYQELIEDQREAAIARVKAALEDVEAGRVRHTTAEELVQEFGLEDRCGSWFEPAGLTAAWRGSRARTRNSGRESRRCYATWKRIRISRGSGCTD